MMISPDAWVNRLSELVFKSVKVSQCVRWDSVEGQSATRTIQIHPNSAATFRGKRSVIIRTIMPRPEECKYVYILCPKTPGNGIISKEGLKFSFSFYPLVCSTNINRTVWTSTQLCLPVVTPSQPLSAQHLALKIKPVWVIRIILPFSTCCLFVSLRQNEVGVCSAWVQGEICGIWWRQKTDLIMVMVKQVSG